MFEIEEPTIVEGEDPAAAFLAREQRTLQGLADELQADVAESAEPPPEIIHVSPPSPVPSANFDNFREKEEPEKIRKWREEQQLRLQQKDAQEEVNKTEMREIAKKELEEWYAQHEEQIAKTKAANRSAEKQFVAESDEMEPGTEWERIAKLCDFNPKSAKSSKDVSRMRSIILQLKQTGLSTPKKA